MISLDAIDRRILERLQQDGRLSNADLAEKVGLSSSPCWRRVRALEEAGVIKGYAALLDAKQVGLSVNVFMSVSLSTQNEKSLKEFERAAAARPEVMECYLMTGDSDYLLRVVVPDLEAGNMLAKQLEYLADAQAAAYVECRTADGRTVFGVGLDTDIATASVRAVLSAAICAVRSVASSLAARSPPSAASCSALGRSAAIIRPALMYADQ